MSKSQLKHRSSPSRWAALKWDVNGLSDSDWRNDRLTAHHTPAPTALGLFITSHCVWRVLTVGLGAPHHCVNTSGWTHVATFHSDRILDDSTRRTVSGLLVYKAVTSNIFSGFESQPCDRSVGHPKAGTIGINFRILNCQTLSAGMEKPGQTKGRTVYEPCPWCPVSNLGHASDKRGIPSLQQ